MLHVLGTHRPSSEAPQARQGYRGSLRQEVGGPALAVHAHELRETRGGGMREVVVAMRSLAMLPEARQAEVIAECRARWAREFPAATVEVVS